VMTGTDDTTGTPGGDTRFVLTDPDERPVPAAGVEMPLFYAAGATEGTSQWRAEALQLVNWGGFEGRVRFDFHPSSTLVSGASGTGKSTLLDGYIALMMPSDTAFNGASNDAAGGRARSAEQRNLLSYLRGKTDSTTDASGREVDQVLRGQGTATWGAVGMTFVDDNGRRLTALRAYYVPASATRAGDISMRMATYDGALDLADLEQCVPDRFAVRGLKAAFEGITTYDTYATFAQTLYTRLGIGANTDGAKALRLLVRIQSGHQIRTVDELYKEMVLETPDSFAKADRAIEHFDDLEASYVAMETEERKERRLAPITEAHERLVAARAELDVLDTFGVARQGATPLTLWSLRTEARLLDAAVDANRVARTAVTEELRDAVTAVTRLADDLEAARTQHRESGGGALDALEDRIREEEQHHATLVDNRDRLAEQVADLRLDLDDVLGSRDAFDALRTEGQQFLATVPDAVERVEEARKPLLHQQGRLLADKRELAADVQDLRGRSGKVPRHLNELRAAVAAASGIDAADLPFVAELIDVAPDEARWRPTIETVLGATARQMLVPAPLLDAFSAAIDHLPLPGRLRFVGAPTDLPDVPVGGTDHVAGKLLYKTSPFRGWVQRELTRDGLNAFCVEDTADLGGGGYRVTVTGQERRPGGRGAHGQDRRRGEVENIIGFDNADAVTELHQRLAQLERELDRIDADLEDLGVEAEDLADRRRAHEAVTHYRWADVDVPGSAERLARLVADRDRILSSDDRLRELQTEVDTLASRLEDARRHKYGLDARHDRLREEQGAYVDRQDALADELDRIEETGSVVLTDEHVARLDEELAVAAQPDDATSLAELPGNLGRLRRRLMESVERSEQQRREASETLATIFSAYLDTWPDPNLGRTAASYPDYAAILDGIRATGLADRRLQWRKKVTEWSGEDLVPLAGAMDASIEEIEDRLRPINEILRSLPFGAEKDRLQIRLRRLAPESVTRFRKNLTRLSAAAATELTEDELERRFTDLREFMGRLRHRTDPRFDPELSDREGLLDVRRHVEITAERRSVLGELRSTYARLGGKSGGESQELVAFIVGAALRFRLGDELRTRPRFAPVFLDEGFVKSDGNFASRAVAAWRGLGFQLIVGAPLDKVTALEPHMGELLVITKSTTTHRSYVQRLTDA